MTTEEYVTSLLAAAPPLTDEQVEGAARILSALPSEPEGPEGGA